MSLQIIRNNIIKVHADAIVNTANPKPRIGSGTDHAIYLAAGPELFEARKKIGRIEPGEVAITPAFHLPAKYIIHAVGPAWKGGDQGEAAILRRAYDNALSVAVDNGCNSIAFPLMAAGTYHFPKEIAIEVAISAFVAFLMHHKNIQIILVTLDKAVYDLAGNIYQNLCSYVNEDYVDDVCAEEYGTDGCAMSFQELKDRLHNLPSVAGDTAFPLTLGEAGVQAEESFHGMLFRLIDEKGLKDSSVYKKASISRQQFSSQFRSVQDCRPSKDAALRLAIALELDYETTQDFLAKAGYTLSPSIRSDRVISRCIQLRQFNPMEIDDALYKEQCPVMFHAVKEK